MKALRTSLSSFPRHSPEKRKRRLPPRRGVRGPRQNPTRANHAREPKKESSHDTLKSPWVRSPSFFVRFRLLKMPTQGAEVRLYLRRRRSRSERRNRNCPSDCIVITSNGIDEITSRLNLKIPDFFFSKVLIRRKYASFYLRAGNEEELKKKTRDMRASRARTAARCEPCS